MTRTRLTAPERTEQLISAAVTAFSLGGYAGTTTDQVARLAGVSQPYVIRIFRTKQELFIAAVQRACDQVGVRFQEAAETEATLECLGEAYRGLLDNQELISMMLHGFSASADPAIGGPVRTKFGQLYDLVRELTGCTAELAPGLVDAAAPLDTGRRDSCAGGEAKVDVEKRKVAAEIEVQRPSRVGIDGGSAGRLGARAEHQLAGGVGDEQAGRRRERRGRGQRQGHSGIGRARHRRSPLKGSRSRVPRHSEGFHAVNRRPPATLRP